MEQPRTVVLGPNPLSEHSAELVKSQVRRVSLWSCLALLLERGYLHPFIIIIILCFYPDNGRAVGHHVEAERDSSPPRTMAQLNSGLQTIPHPANLKTEPGPSRYTISGKYISIHAFNVL